VSEIGRCKLFASDRMEFVTEGYDENGQKCWRTYVGMAKPDGQIMFSAATLAYSPPDDWPELGLSGE
jgi:hypothetical protein